MELTDLIRAISESEDELPGKWEWIEALKEIDRRLSALEADQK